MRKDGAPLRSAIVSVGTAVLALAGCSSRMRGDVGVTAEGVMVCARGATTSGIDISHYQGTVDWAAAKGGGIDFAFMKATEGTTFVDPMFATNWSGAGASGVIRGAYHFFRPSVDAVMQADFFVRNAGIPAAGDLPPTIDLEVTDGLGGAQVAQAALQFLQRVEASTGRRPIIYTSPSFFTSSLGGPSGFDGYVLWVANWQVTCPDVPSPPWGDWNFWQTSDSGTVPGVSGTVDTDVFNGSLSDLRSFTNGGAPSPDLGGTGGRDAGPDSGPVADGGAGGVDAARPGGGGNPTPDAGQPRQISGGCSYGGGTRSLPSSMLLLLSLACLAVSERARRGTAPPRR